jgi:hypothetical protein
MTDNPFAPDRAYTIPDFISKAAGVCRASVYTKLKSGELRGKNFGKRTVITNAHSWWAAQPDFKSGTRSYGVKIGRAA